MHPALIVLVTLTYIALLFALARWTERSSLGARLSRSPAVYSLSLAVYCTAWTYFGSVGKAATSGLVFLTIYLGPTVCAAVWPMVVRKLVRLKDIHHLTSIADVVSARYGKSGPIAALATLAAFVGIMPYVALQLKSVAGTFAAITGPAAQGYEPFAANVDAGVAVLMTLFTIVFGVRRLDPTERHPGMVMAVAAESVVKLTAFVSAGVFIVFFANDGLSALFSNTTAYPYYLSSHIAQPGESAYSSWMSSLVLAMSAILFLPRQFHVAVVENSDVKHIGTAMWLFPLYLLLINLFVVPIALAGLKAGLPLTEADTYVLRLPLLSGQLWLSAFVFLGGFSAAASMVMIEAMAMSTMLTNHILLPLTGWFTVLTPLKRRLLHCRWVSVAVFLGASLWFERAIGESWLLADIGIMAFAAALQFAPAILGGLYWREASKTGAALGLAAGFLVWSQTMLAPAFVKAGLMDATPLDWLAGGLGFGGQALTPTTGLDPLTATVFWSMVANIGCYVLFSLVFPQTEAERDIADGFVDALAVEARSVRRPGQASIDLAAKTARILPLLREYFDQDQSVETLRKCIDRAGLSGKPLITVVELADLYGAVESHLAGAVGASAAHGALSVAGIFTPKETLDLSEAYGEILADLKLTPDDLRSRIDYYQEREKMLALHAGELEDKVRERDHEIEVRKRAEDEARLAEARFRGIFENAPVGIYQSTPAGRYVRVNPQFARIFGYDSPDDMIASVADIARDVWLRPEDRERMAGILDRDGEVIAYEAENKRKDGTPIWTSRNLRTVRAGDGGITLYDGFVTDITARKKAQAELLRLNQELEARVATRTNQLENANAELLRTLGTLKTTQNQLVESEKMAALGNLVAGVAHEVNTPLGVALTAATHLEETAKAMQLVHESGSMTKSAFEGFMTTSTESAVMIAANLRRAADLVRSFKMVAVDQSTEERRAFILCDYLREVLLSLRPKLKKTKHTVEVVCPDDLVIVSFPGAFSQILTNLLVNSLVHGFGEGQAGTIRIEVRVEGGRLIFVYADNGKGIAEDVLPRIFEPFYTTSRVKGGSGLGLYILYNLVTQTLKGTVACESREGQGARFTIDLPVELAGHPPVSPIS